MEIKATAPVVLLGLAAREAAAACLAAGGFACGTLFVLYGLSVHPTQSPGTNNGTTYAQESVIIKNVLLYLGTTLTYVPFTRTYCLRPARLYVRLYVRLLMAAIVGDWRHGMGFSARWRASRRAIKTLRVRWTTGYARIYSKSLARRRTVAQTRRSIRRTLTGRVRW